MKLCFWVVILARCVFFSDGFRRNGTPKLLLPRVMSRPAPTEAPPKQQISPILQSLNSNILGLAKASMDRIYGNRSIDRFYTLETVARMPYFAYISVLHLYETFGWFRKPEHIRNHFDENVNEMYHLKVMEQLGGGNKTLDRLLARSASVFFFWFNVMLYVISPATAYNLSKLIEEHAYISYTDFIEKNEEYLRSEPASQIGIKYYGLAMKEAKSSNKITSPLTLYDIFVRIRDDEKEHAASMAVSQDYVIGAAKL